MSNRRPSSSSSSFNNITAARRSSILSSNVDSTQSNDGTHNSRRGSILASSNNNAQRRSMIVSSSPPPPSRSNSFNKNKNSYPYLRQSSDSSRSLSNRQQHQHQYHYSQQEMEVIELTDSNSILPTETTLTEAITKKLITTAITSKKHLAKKIIMLEQNYNKTMIDAIKENNLILLDAFLFLHRNHFAEDKALPHSIIYGINTKISGVCNSRKSRGNSIHEFFNDHQNQNEFFTTRINQNSNDNNNNKSLSDNILNFKTNPTRSSNNNNNNNNDDELYSMLHFIIREDRLKMLELFLEYKFFDINGKDSTYSGITPLMEAIMSYDNQFGFQIVSNLIMYGARLDSRDSMGENVLHYAAQYTNGVFIIKLIDVALQKNHNNNNKRSLKTSQSIVTNNENNPKIHYDIIDIINLIYQKNYKGKNVIDVCDNMTIRKYLLSIVQNKNTKMI